MNINMYEDHPLDSTLNLRSEGENISAGNDFFGVAQKTPAGMENLGDAIECSDETFRELLSEQDEMEQLADALVNDTPTFVDESGTIHIELDGEASAQNIVQVDGNVFGGPIEEDEVQRLADAMYNDDGDGYWVDEFGRIRLGDAPVGSENMTKVDGNIFGTPNEIDEVQQLADAMYNDDGDGYWVDEFGRIRLGDAPVGSENMTKVDGNIFGAHEDQWYNKNPRLMKAEVATMRKHYPKAAFSYYSGNGNMYWIVTLDIFNNKNITKPWQFLLVYDKDHPHNNGFGGSVKVVPLKPSMDELRKIALQHGRPGVPHIIFNDSHFLKRYLCTRWPKDIESGEDLVSSATQAAAWAADWAAHFEVGIRDKRVWNKWCDDAHFRHLQVK